MKFVFVKLRKNETSQNLIKRFIRKAKQEGIVEEYKKRMFFEKPSTKRRREKARRKKVLAKLKKTEQ